MTLKYAGTLPRTRTRARPGAAPGAAAAVRSVAMRAVVWLACGPARIHGRDRIPDGPVIVVANHASHADTPLLLAAIGRRPLAPAAAADYFFRNRILGAIMRWVVGAFPFPRRGAAGLDRAHARLLAGHSVLLFPEGTRTTDGTIATFKSGAARLAARAGVPIVPAGIAGMRDVLAKGARVPRRRGVAVVFGEPIHTGGGDAHAMTDCAEAAVKRAAAAAEAARVHRPALHARVRAFAGTRAALAVAFAWGAAEALAWPIVPDLLVATLVLAAPRRILPIAGAAALGSVAGGIAAYGLGALGASGVLDRVPLVTERMQADALARMDARGAAGILSQPWSGIPYKVFAYQAHESTGLGGFAAVSLLARGARILQVAALFAAAAIGLRRWIGRLYPWLVAAYTAIFFYGLSRVVGSWS